MKTFIEFITENVDKIDVNGNEIRVVDNPSTGQVEGLLNQAMAKNEGQVRWLLRDDKLHAWHGEAIHQDINESLYGENRFKYREMRKDKSIESASGIFHRNGGYDEHFSIGHELKKDLDHILKSPRFSHILPHPDGGKKRRHIENFST